MWRRWREGHRDDGRLRASRYSRLSVKAACVGWLLVLYEDVHFLACYMDALFWCMFGGGVMMVVGFESEFKPRRRLGLF